VTTALVSVTAVLATLVVVLLVILVTRRPRNPSAAAEPAPPPAPAPTAAPVPIQVTATEAAPPPVPITSYESERLEAMVRELREALERSRAENRRGRFLSQLAGALDLEDVLGRTLEAAHDLPGVDAALIVLQQNEGGPLVATHGMSRDEALNQPVAPPLEGRQPRAVALNYRYAEADIGRDGNLIRGGLLVPLLGVRHDSVGTLAVFWRGRDRDASADEVAQLEELAGSAGPMIENARRFLEARQLAELDALTGLHNRRYFDEVLDREVSRANRYGRSLALILLDLDDFKAINDRIGHLAGDAVLAELGERVRDSLRSADIACRIGGDELAVIMPESTFEDAQLLYDRLQEGITARPFATGERMSASAGIAELERDDDARALFERADQALYRAKGEGKNRAR
jgi:diguanylate cyclase (GGDEF)-like protein